MTTYQIPTTEPSLPVLNYILVKYQIDVLSIHPLYIKIFISVCHQYIRLYHVFLSNLTTSSTNMHFTVFFFLPILYNLFNLIHPLCFTFLKFYLISINFHMFILVYCYINVRISYLYFKNKILNPCVVDYHKANKRLEGPFRQIVFIVLFQAKDMQSLSFFHRKM